VQQLNAYRETTKSLVLPPPAAPPAAPAAPAAPVPAAHAAPPAAMLAAAPDAPVLPQQRPQGRAQMQAILQGRVAPAFARRPFSWSFAQQPERVVLDIESDSDVEEDVGQAAAELSPMDIKEEQSEAAASIATPAEVPDPGGAATPTEVPDPGGAATPTEVPYPGGAATPTEVPGAGPATPTETPDLPIQVPMEFCLQGHDLGLKPVPKPVPWKRKSGQFRGEGVYATTCDMCKAPCIAHTWHCEECHYDICVVCRPAKKRARSSD
jgi:hypothetical protein